MEEILNRYDIRAARRQNTSRSITRWASILGPSRNREFLAGLGGDDVDEAAGDVDYAADGLAVGVGLDAG